MIFKLLLLSFVCVVETVRNVKIASKQWQNVYRSQQDDGASSLPLLGRVGANVAQQLKQQQQQQQQNNQQLRKSSLHLTANEFAELREQEAKQRETALAHAQAIANARKRRRSDALSRLLHEYELLHNDAFSGQLSYKGPRYRFLVWRGAGGVGDQMLSLVSAFALALLTNRVFIAHSTLTQEFIAPFHYGWMGTHPAFYVTDDMLETKLYLTSPDADIARIMCVDPHGVTQKSWRVSSSFYFAALLWLNPFVNQTMVRLFPSGNMFGVLSDYLFSKPNQIILNQLKEFEMNHFGEYNVGVHVRIARGDTPSPSEIEAITKFQYGAFSSVAQRAGQSESDARKLAMLHHRLRFIVSSQYPAAKLLLEKAFDKADVRYFQIVDQNELNDTIRLHRSIIDWKLLSVCDDLVLSHPNSQFGRSLSAAAGISQWVITSDGDCERVAFPNITMDIQQQQSNNASSLRAISSIDRHLFDEYRLPYITCRPEMKF